MELIKLAVILQLITACAQGSYLIELRIESYTNPSNKCAECSLTERFVRDFGCCDGFEVVSGPCRDDDRCDNYFRYCLRDLGTSNQIIGCPGNSILSEFPDRDGGDFNRDTQFSSSEVLGLPNPLPLVGQETQWQGIQIYIEPRDYDPSGDDETIDIITMDIPSSIVDLPDSPESGVIHLTGRFNFTMITIRYRVLCQQFFYGNFCENFDNCLSENIMCENGGTCRDLDDDYKCECVPGYLGRRCEDIDHCFDKSCSNQGQCQALSDSFVCECDPGYTGQLCEIELNECIGVNCSERGVCEDRVNSFICRCDPGYTGQECELDIDDCVGVTCSGNGQCIDGIGTFTCLCDQGFTGPECDTLLSNFFNAQGNIPGPPLIGGIAGGVLLIILILIAIILVACVLKRERNRKTEEPPPSPTQDGYHAYGQDNPVYGAPMTQSVTSYTSVSTNSTSTGNSSSISQPNLDESDEQIYSEPTYHTASNSDEEREFQNPLYRSSEDITSSEAESSGKVFSFIGSTGSGYPSIHENEILI